MADESQVLEIRECPICHRNSVDGTCGNCGFKLETKKVTKLAEKPETGEDVNASQ